VEFPQEGCVLCSLMVSCRPLIFFKPGCFRAAGRCQRQSYNFHGCCCIACRTLAVSGAPQVLAVSETTLKRSARALRCLDRCEAPERTRPASYILVDTVGLRTALGRSGNRSAIAGKCSARYLAPRYCTHLNHTQGISHKPLRRAGAFQAAAHSRRTAPSALGESVGTEFCATTASRAAVSRAVDSCSSRLCSEAAARRAREAGLFPRIRRRRVWRSRGVTRREQSARGAEQQGCHCAPCTRRANVPLVCKVRSCLRRSCCLPCGSHFFDPTGLQNKLPGCRLVTLVLFFAGLGGSTLQS